MTRPDVAAAPQRHDGDRAASPSSRSPNLKKYFPIKSSGHPPAQHRLGAGRRRGLLPGRARQRARPGGGVRLRQVDHRPADHPALRPDRRVDEVRRPRDRQPVEQADAAAAQRDPDDLPGPVQLAEPAAHRRHDRRHAAAGAQDGPGEQGPGPGPRAARGRRASTPSTTTATRTSSPAASASASASPARWRCSRSCWSPTSRSPRSTCRSRRRSSTCCRTCSASSASRSCSSRTTSPWSGTSAPRSR